MKHYPLLLAFFAAVCVYAADSLAPSEPAAEPVFDELDTTLVDDSALAAKRPRITADGTGEAGSLVNIECESATLSDVLRQFRKIARANIICRDETNLSRTVSVNLQRVTWLQGLREILNSCGFRLDESDGIYRVIEDRQTIPLNTRTFALNHASARELTDLFNTSFAPKRPDGKVLQPIATAFEGANTVVVTATDKIIADCASIVKAVDRAVSQVYIEARFIEISNEALHKLGMQWNSLASWGATVRNLNGGMEFNRGSAANYGRALTTSTSTSSINNSGGTSGSTTSSSVNNSYAGIQPEEIAAASGAGRTAENMSWSSARGFSGQLSLDDFRLAMSAFESMQDVKIFSNPKIIVSNGKEAMVDMTTKYPNVAISSEYTGQNSQNLSISTRLEAIPGEDNLMFAKEAFFSWGIQLSVTPRISPDGLISVEIVPTVSSCTDYVQVNSSQQTGSPYTQYPIIDLKRLRTEFTMKDGSTAVIGGLSRTTEEDIDSGIPYLRKIPWIGPRLFGWKSRGKVQKEIVVFVTVGLANPAELPADIGLPKNAVYSRDYVRRIKLEPGDRVETADPLLRLNLTPLDERDETGAPAGPLAPGSVIITPVKPEPVPAKLTAPLPVERVDETLTEARPR